MRTNKWFVYALCVLSMLSMSSSTPVRSAPVSLVDAPQVFVKTAQDGIPSAVLNWDALQLSKIDEFESG